MPKEHSNFMKGIAVCMMLCHKSSKVIQEKTGISKSTQKRIIETYLQNTKGDPEKLTHICGRKKALSDEVAGKIRKAVNANRRLTAKGIE